jgi:hypothetical protein
VVKAQGGERCRVSTGLKRKLNSGAKGETEIPSVIHLFFPSELLGSLSSEIPKGQEHLGLILLTFNAFVLFCLSSLIWTGGRLRAGKTLKSKMKETRGRL